MTQDYPLRTQGTLLSPADPQRIFEGILLEDLDAPDSYNDPPTEARVALLGVNEDGSAFVRRGEFRVKNRMMWITGDEGDYIQWVATVNGENLVIYVNGR